MFKNLLGKNCCSGSVTVLTCGNCSFTSNTIHMAATILNESAPSPPFPPTPPPPAGYSYPTGGLVTVPMTLIPVNGLIVPIAFYTTGWILLGGSSPIPGPTYTWGMWTLVCGSTIDKPVHVTLNWQIVTMPNNVSTPPVGYNGSGQGIFGGGFYVSGPSRGSTCSPLLLLWPNSSSNVGVPATDGSITITY